MTFVIMGPFLLCITYAEPKKFLSFYRNLK